MLELNAERRLSIEMMNGRRGGRIRTGGLLLPKQAR